MVARTSGKPFVVIIPRATRGRSRFENKNTWAQPDDGMYFLPEKPHLHVSMHWRASPSVAAFVCLPPAQLCWLGCLDSELRVQAQHERAG